MLAQWNDSLRFRINFKRGSCLFMMTRPKVGVKRKRAGSMERKGSKSKKDQRPDPQEETLVERVTQAVLEALEDRAVPAIPDRSETPRV